jgi:ubiquinone/menaquinone biosynthesis C-methylase UbiE
LEQHGAWHHMDETRRREWQNPEAILKDIGLEPGYTFLDIGAGSGFFALPASRMVGPRGKIYTLDLHQEGLDEIHKRASAEGLTNMVTLAGKAEENLVCKACADIAFFGIVLHDFENPARVLSNARLMLKPQGKLANLDWKKINMNFGPPFEKRFDESTASLLIEEAGFSIESVKNSGQYHYLIIAAPR